MPERITNKKMMYEKLRAGLLGNTHRSAETVAEAEAMLARPGLYAIRSKLTNRGTKFNLTPAQAWAVIRAMPAGSWNLSAMLSDDHRVCYGHLMDGVGGWALLYSDTPKPCKLMPSVDGCEEKRLNGLAARLYLRRIMDDIGWLTLLELVEQYPDHVIEFNVMADAHQAHGPSNVIFWEVRSICGAYERDTWK